MGERTASRHCYAIRENLPVLVSKASDDTAVHVTCTP